MEVMDMSLDKFYKMLYENSKTIPEDILGKIAVAVSTCAVVFTEMEEWRFSWCCIMYIKIVSVVTV